MPGSIAGVREDEHGFTYVDTGDCPFCGKRGEVIIPPQLKLPFERWRRGGRWIQNEMAALSDDEREQLMSGIHGACYDEEYPEDDEP